MEGRVASHFPLLFDPLPLATHLSLPPRQMGALAGGRSSFGRSVGRLDCLRDNKLALTAEKRQTAIDMHGAARRGG